jgi:murein DD-endopeptidase MepM/ murein hydrolase activator NlpD
MHEWRPVEGCVHIILVSNRLAKTRSVEVSLGQALLGMAGVIVGIAVLAFLLFYFGVRNAARIELPMLHSLVRWVQHEDASKTQEFMRDNLNALAVRLGEMQAQLVRLEALGERLSSVMGVRAGDFRLSERPARGGASPSTPLNHELSLAELSAQLDLVARQMENRSDQYGLLESQLLDSTVRQTLIPSAMPLQLNTWKASGFGWRIDPFTGQMSMHEGVDFAADIGTPIHAAAAGVVVTAGFHPGYGNMIEMDHGDDLLTRYAHASKLLVKPGDLVRRGHKLAEVGNSGRSTGPHLHFEVRLKGVAQNPAKFLTARARTFARP